MTKKNLFYNIYQADSSQRQAELDLCLKMNQRVFDEVILVEGRPTFQELFAMSRPGSINVFCNSDIYFPDVTLLEKIGENDFWCLTRWDIKKGKEVFFNRRDSFDAFVCRGVIRSLDVPYPAGYWGVDDRIAYEAHNAGYVVSNPSWTVKTIHLHAIDKRNHVRTHENTCPPPYLTLEPTNLKNI